MRGFGAELWSRLLVYMAYLKDLLGNRSEAYADIHHAEVLHTGYPPHFHARYVDWIGSVKARLSLSSARG